MSVEEVLKARSESKCELCSSKENLGIFEVPPSTAGGLDQRILVCSLCKNQIDSFEELDANHWRCLNDSMWSQVPAVQVVVWRLLNRLSSEGWPLELLEMLYLEEEILTWAKATGEGNNEDEIVKHKDSNGVVLQAGDAVVLIKDLNVKGANFTAKRGAVVRNISLSHDNPEHIEGKVNGQQIVILTKFVKKS